MNSDLVKDQTQEVDGFDGYEDAVEGQDQQGGGIIQGSVIKFTNESTWVTRDGEEISPNLELVVINVLRVVQRWGKDQKPLETLILEPGQKFPDIEALNEKVPRAEWLKGLNGEPSGPYQAQRVVYLLNPATLDRYTYPTGTTGGAICIRDLTDKVKWMHKFRGSNNVYPVITLSDTFFPTKFGGRQRPHFLIKRWIRLGGEEKPALPTPAAPKLEHSPTTAPTQPGVKEVKPPTLAEELNDQLPF